MAPNGGVPSTCQGVTTGNVPRGLSVAKNVRDQWATNLGVHGEIEVQELSAARQWCGTPPAVSLNGFILPFDEPHFWYRREFVSGGACWDGYRNPSFEQVLNTADLEQPSQAIGDYVKAGRLLVDDAAYIGLLYSKRAMLIRPYVKGVGFNAIYDYPWSEIKILQH